MNLAHLQNSITKAVPPPPPAKAAVPPIPRDSSSAAIKAEPGRAPAELKQLLKWYSELYQFAPVGFVDLDHRGFIQQINRTAANFIGIPQTELIGKPFVQFIATRDIQKFVAHLRQTLQGASRRPSEVRLRPHGNEAIVVQLCSTTLHLPGSAQPICRTALTDITERRLAEEALRESKECFRIMTETAPVLVWMTGADGQCTYFNKNWLEFTGRSLKEDLGQGWLEVVHPDERQRFLDVYASAFQEREKFTFEFRLRRNDKQYRWFLSTAVPRFTPAKAFAGYLGSCIDITERKEAEEMRRQILEDLEILVQERTANLKAANRKLRREVVARKRLEKQIVEVADSEKRRIGNDLHDGLGQQLTGISFLSKLLEQKLTSKSLPESTDAARVHQLLSQALNHTRELARGLHVVELDAGGFTNALQELRSQVEALFCISCQMRIDKSVRIDDPAVATHLFRITQEAVNNAIKHGNAKSVSISLTKADKKITLAIKDDGAGFPATTSGRKGMGLHTMRYRSEMIRGTFEIQRPLEGGTLVLCSFPFKATKKLNA